jgi:hypothetical protein
MATISNTPRPGYVWDSTDNVWYPIGTGPHTHSDYITSSSAINPTIVDAKGDLIAATAADTVARLAVGTDAQVLTADSSTATGLKWATPTAGGMTLISTTTLSGASIVLSSIPATYKDLQLVVRNFVPATDNLNLRLRINADTNTRYFTLTTNSASNDGTTTFGSAQIDISGNNDNSVGNGLSVVNIYDYANAVTWKMVDFTSIAVNSTTTTTGQIYNGAGYFNQTGAITSLTLFVNSGNLTSGTALLYGVS